MYVQYFTPVRGVTLGHQNAMKYQVLIDPETMWVFFYCLLNTH